MTNEKTEVDWNKDTHALVKFIDEDCPGIIPLKRLVQKENVEYNGSCGVRWSNGKVYKSFLICSGTREECSAKQDEIDGPDSEDDGESMCEEHDKRKRANRPSKKQQSSKAKKPKNDFSLYVGPAPPSLPLEKAAILEDKQKKSVAVSQNNESSVKHNEDLNADVEEQEDEETEEEDTEEDEVINEKPVHRIKVDDGPGDHLALPKHLIPDHDHRDVIEKIDSLKKQMEDFKDSQRVWMEAKFNGILSQINLLFASGIAKSLSPVVNQSYQQPPVTPSTPETSQQPSAVAAPGTSQQPSAVYIPAVPGISQQPSAGYTPAPGTSQQPSAVYTPAAPGISQQPSAVYTPTTPGTSQPAVYTPAIDS